ncbi:MAG: hypothetical protein JWN34_3008 [Bryobacterales bacterium]|nr:hypothetical protein [Bryobacterales bacterium]
MPAACLVFVDVAHPNHMGFRIKHQLALLDSGTGVDAFLQIPDTLRGNASGRENVLLHCQGGSKVLPCGQPCDNRLNVGSPTTLFWRGLRLMPWTIFLLRETMREPNEASEFDQSAITMFVRDRQSDYGPRPGRKLEAPH